MVVKREWLNEQWQIYQDTATKPTKEEFKEIIKEKLEHTKWMLEQYKLRYSKKAFEMALIHWERAHPNDDLMLSSELNQYLSGKPDNPEEARYHRTLDEIYPQSEEEEVKATLAFNNQVAAIVPPEVHEPDLSELSALPPLTPAQKARDYPQELWDRVLTKRPSAAPKVPSAAPKPKVEVSAAPKVVPAASKVARVASVSPPTAPKVKSG